MEKRVKYFLWIVLVGLFIGISIALNMPRPSMTLFEQNKLKEIVHRWNYDLPRTIGSIGSMDSIVYRDRTIIYNISVYGDSRIKEVYVQNYKDFKDMLKYSLLAMNGQNNMGDTFVSILNDKEINLAFRVYTEDRNFTEWEMPGSELKEFVDVCKTNPTSALSTVIDLHIKISNINLPIKFEDIHDPIQSVYLNSFIGEIDESCLPQSVSHIDNEIYFEYNVDEDVINVNELEKVKENSEMLDIFAYSLTEDPDVQEFFGILAISHSNVVLIYEGRNSHKRIKIRIPYTLLKKYSKVPKYLLS